MMSTVVSSQELELILTVPGVLPNGIVIHGYAPEPILFDMVGPPLPPMIEGEKDE